VLGSGYGVKLGRKCLEVGILSEFALGLRELALSLGFEMDLGRAQWIFLFNKVILVDGF
jgi:hypothetical protein